jgi:HTH-type transcriptional regulator/antitoxin HipB
MASASWLSRQWVIEVERGHPRAELDLVLRALDELHIHLDASTDPAKHRSSIKPAVDIHAIVARAKGKA